MAIPVSASTVIPYGTNITGNVTWSKAASPYIVSGMGVAAGGTLTIEPGVIVKFEQYAGIGISGSLIVGAPAPAEPVIITSLKDDIGGDDNADGTLTTPHAGDWGALYFSGPSTTITNTIVHYGGRNAPALFINQGADLTISGSTLRDSQSDIIRGESGSTYIDTSTFRRALNGINVLSGSLSLATTTFTTLTTSVLISGAVPFTNHGGNSGEGGYELTGTLYGDQTWNKDGLPYLIQSFGTAATSSLTILPGTVVKFLQGGGFGAAGTLTVGEPNSSDPVILTSYRDDSILGDTNKDGDASTAIPGDWGGIYLFSTSSINNAHFTFGGSVGGALNNYGGTLTMNGSTIEKSGSANFFQHAGTSTLTNTSFSAGSFGSYLDGGDLSIHQSSITGNTYGIFNATTHDVDATANWWGHIGGPTYSGNPFGAGDRVSDHVNYGNWLSDVPGAACSTNCYSNVLFLPGMMGSRLFEQSSACGVFNNEKERWVSTLDCDHSHLALDASGKSIYSLYTKEGNQGVIDDTYGSNIYQSFMGDLADWKSEGTINDYALLPYDWRISLEDILQNGASSTGKLSYGTSQGFQHSYIYQKLKGLADSSRTKKVTIIAHSNGGLVTKALIQKLKETNDPLYDKIDKVIFVAVPQSGTPETIGSLLHGANIGPGGVVISSKRVRDLLHNMPFAYNLLPTAAYVGTGTPLVEFSGFAATSSFGKYGASINTIQNLNDYLNGGDGRTVPVYADLLHAQIVNSSLLSGAESVHAALDNWTPSTSTEVYEIAGWGVHTITGLKYEPNKICIVSSSTVPVQPGVPQMPSCAGYINSYKISDKFVVDGDGTVIRRSAHQMASSSNVHQYWLDLNRYNQGPTINRDHKDIFEASVLPVFLKSVVVGAPQTNQFLLNSVGGLSIIHKVLKYEIHSPLNLSIYDSLGNHTGISTTTGLIELGVKGSLYREIGDSKIIIVDASIAHTMKLDAYDSGSFTLDIEKLDGDSIVSSTTFMGIPTSTTTKASLDWFSGEDIGTTTKLTVDYNGDSVVDSVLVAKVGDIVLLPASDLTPPTTAASINGTLGNSGWYTSNVLVTLNATDIESGAASTSYSLNSGATWTTYTIPFTISTEGSTTILYYSTDNAGNRETTNTLQIKIDKTAPEAQVSVSTSTQDILVEGTDNLGATTVSKDTSGNVAVTDQAGHNTKLYFTKTYNGKLLTYVKLTGVQYDAQPKVTLPSSSFLYIWDTKAPVTLASQTIAVDNTYLIQATYDKSKNKTTVIVLKKNLPVQTQVVTGLKVIKLTTSKGVVGYSF